MAELLAELRTAFDQTKQGDPLSRVLPVKLVAEQWISQVKTGYGPGHMSAQPAFFRRSGAREDIASLAHQMALFFHVLAAQALTGGINAFDPETGTSVHFDQGVAVRRYQGLRDLLQLPGTLRSFETPGRWQLVCNHLAEATVRSLWGSGEVEVVGIATLWDRAVPGADQFVERAYTWPIDVITAIWRPEDAPVGHTVLCAAETDDLVSGPWAREHAGAIQVGCSGLPVLDRPEHVFVFKPA